MPAAARADNPTDTKPKRRGRAKFSIILQKDMTPPNVDAFDGRADFRDVPDKTFKTDAAAFASIAPEDDGFYRTINVRICRHAKTVKSVELTA